MSSFFRIPVAPSHKTPLSNRNTSLPPTLKWRVDYRDGKKPFKLAIDFLDEIGFTCYWAGRGELWRITGCWQPHYGGVFESNVACAHRELAPSLLEKMETVFQETLSPSVFPEPPIDIADFQNHIKYRYSSVLLRDSDGNERYLLTVVDRDFDGSTQITAPSCVWLDHPGQPAQLGRPELQAAAARFGCVRMIAVDRRPPGVSDDVVKKELHHAVGVVAQNAYFLEEGRSWSKKFDAFHFVSESDQKVTL